MTNTNVIYYSDVYLGFKPNQVDGDLIVLENEDSVKQGLKIIILTNFHEKFHRPYEGGNVISKLFENVDDISAQIIKTQISTIIKNYCSYVSVLDLIVKPDFDGNSFYVSIVFSVQNINKPLTVSMFLKRQR